MKLDGERRLSMQRGRRRFHGLAVAIALLSPLAVLYPALIERGIGSAPVFNKPNVLIDMGPGWVESALHCGPDIAATTNGTIHAVWSDNKMGTDNVYHAVSYNHGITWSHEKNIDALPGGSNVARLIAVDVSGGPYTDSVYVTWQNGDMNQADISLTRSVDDGETWSMPTRLDSSQYSVPSVCPRIAVDSDGMVYMVFMDKRSGSWSVFVAKSADGGSVLSADFRPYVSANQEMYPSIAADGGLVDIK